MKQKMLKIITVITIIATLTMANFLLLCTNVVSYAVEAVSAEKNTNNKNIEFEAYLKNEEGEKVDNLKSKINAENLRLYFQISVKKEGLFNGNIVLNNANFKFKKEFTNNTISSIEDNKIYLNQINAGETKEIEVEIELLKEEQFDLNLINMESTILLEGIYRDSTQKDIDIYANRNIKINMVSPYNNSEDSIKLSQEIITNKVAKYNGEEKRIIQVQLTSGISNNLYPIKSSIIKVQAPKIIDEYPEMFIYSNYTLATNGKTLQQDNWNYNKQTGLATIKIDNNIENNKITWKKSGEDKFIISYIYSKDTEVSENKIGVSSEINLYDIADTKFNAVSEIQIGQNEKDSIISAEIIQNETDIYKGKLYAGIKRNIKYTTYINSNLVGVVSEINLTEECQKINDIKIESTYNNTIINKENVLNILGNNGELLILNAENNAEIAKVNSSSETDENGNVVVSYEEGISEIKVKTTAPQNVGNIKLLTTKTIGKIENNALKTSTEITTKLNGTIMENTQNINLQETESVIELKETETKTQLKLNKTELSTMSTNNVEMKVILNSRDENNDLFRNPTLKIQLPETVQNIDIKSVQLADEDQLTKEYVQVLNGNVVEIKLSGEQTSYKDKAIEGAMLILNMDITLNKKLPSSKEQIILTCENGEKISQEKVSVNFVSYAGLVTINRIDGYDAEIINHQGNKEVIIPIKQRTRGVNSTVVENEIINNEENEITNVNILGTFPTKDAVSGNNFDIAVGEILVTGVDTSRIKVYYTENANATKDLADTGNGWSENITDSKNVKKYLIVIDKLAVKEGVKAAYDVEFPDDLEYNLTAKQGYTVYYTNVTVEKEIVTDYITINTEKGANLDVNLKALVASKEIMTVKEGEIIRYVVSITNNGTEEMKNAKLIAQVPENTILIDSDKLNSTLQIEGETEENEEQIELSKTTLEFVIDKISKGETITKFYEVRAKQGSAGNIISNSIQLQYGDVTKKSNEVRTTIEQGALTVQLKNTEESSVLKNGYNYRYVLTVKNQLNKKVTNATVTINNPEGINITKLFYISDEYVSVENSNTLTIKELEAEGELTVAIYVVTDMKTDKEYEDVSLTAKVTVNNVDYNANELNCRIENDTKDLEMSVTSENSGKYVQTGDKIKYNIIVKNNGSNKINKIKINNLLSNHVSLRNITRNDEMMLKDSYDMENDEETKQKLLVLSEGIIEPGSTITYTIEVEVDISDEESEVIQIINETNLRCSYRVVKTERIEHIYKAEEIVEDNKNNENAGNNENNTNNGQNGNNNTENSGYLISGTAWIDANENGQKDLNEKLLEGNKIKLLNTKTNEFVKDSNGNVIEAITNSQGFYAFTKIQKGQYLVIFEYDTSIYGITTFEKEGVLNENTSKAIEKNILIDGKETKVGATEKIDLSKDISGINIGLVPAKKYDMQLDKYVTKITVQNSKTTTTEYEDTQLAKQEINAKEVNSTTVVVEYTIKVTNKGDVAGYVKKIADYLSSDYKFSSELNKEWYQDKDTVYCTSLSDIKINPGESKEVKLTVIKQMKENNTGLVNNTAEIVSSYNELGLTDINSTEGNKVKGENDMSSADIIISIKTGQVVTTVILVITTIVILGVAVYLIKRIIINRNII